MLSASKLAGFIAAHAVWCVKDGEMLVPIFAYAHGDERKLERLVDTDHVEAVQYGRSRLEQNETGADDGVLCYDARIDTEVGKLDALVLEIRDYSHPEARATLAVPYTPKKPGGLFKKPSHFLVHKPKLREWSGCDSFDVNASLAAFWEGVALHDEGAKIWNEALDESK